LWTHNGSTREKNGIQENFPNDVAHIVRATVWLAAIAVPLFVVVPAVWYLVHTKTRSPYCTNWKGLLDMRVQTRGGSASRRIAKEMRQVGHDPKLGLFLWATPNGRFWTLAASPLLGYLLAQQQATYTAMNRPASTAGM